MCEYTFELSEWRNENQDRYFSGIEESNLDLMFRGYHWDCPHRSHDQSEYCIFHMSELERNELGITPENIKKNLIDAIRSEDKSQQFIGCEFPHLDLEFASLVPPDNNQIQFKFAVFKGEVDFRNAEIADVSFSWATFEEGVSFHQTKCSKRVILFGVNCEDKLHLFSEIDGYLNLDGAVVEGRSTPGGTFDGLVTIREATFNGEFRADNGEFNDKLSIQDTTFNDEIDMSKSDISEIALGPIDLDEKSEMDMRGSEIDSGYIDISNNLFIDMSGSTIGDVTIDSECNNYLNHIRFLTTRFDGFDFGQYRNYLADVGWEMHKYSYKNEKSKQSPAILENTYLHARNGANLTGDKKTASKLFIKEMKFRRKNYSNRFGDSDGLREKLYYLVQWVSNFSLEKSSKYGESPLRVMAISAAVIVLSAFLYLIGGGILHTDSGNVYNLSTAHSAWDIIRSAGVGIYFSTVNFTTLGADNLQYSNNFTATIAAIESLMGALLIALFIFVIGRNVSK